MNNKEIYLNQKKNPIYNNSDFLAELAVLMEKYDAKIGYDYDECNFYIECANKEIVQFIGNTEYDYMNYFNSEYIKQL